MTGACTRILGNLDCEHHWARLAARGTGRVPRALPQKVLERVSLYATLLRVLGEEGDELWTPVPVNPACLRSIPGLPNVRLLSGRAARIPSNRQVLSWADAPPRRLPQQRLETAMRVNDRAFVLGNGWGLPGARMVDSLEGFEHARPTDSAWIAKAPHSTAGRDRVVGAAGDTTDEAQAGIARLLRAQGQVLVEPWRERTFDFGLWGTARKDAAQALAYHEQEVGARGRFQGIIVPPRAQQPSSLPEEMQRPGASVRAALQAEGYEGPFGIDGWRYRSSDGTEHTNSVGEINARLTFGRVAAALVERVAYPHWRTDTDHVALRFGEAPGTGVDDKRIPLLVSADGVRILVWLERLPLPSQAGRHVR